MKHTNKNGMALVLVIFFAMALLIMGGGLMKNTTQNKPINQRHYERMQADFLGQGIVNLASMKFKKRPAEFYFAYKASRAPIPVTQPLTDYLQNDPTLNGAFVDSRGNTYNFFTTMELISNDVFDTDGIRVTVTVEQLAPDGTVALTRTQQHTLKAERKAL